LCEWGVFGLCYKFKKGMIQEIIQFGQIQLALTAYTPTARTCLLDFLSHLPKNISVVKAHSKEVKWGLHIIAADLGNPSLLEIPGEHERLWRKLHRTCLNGKSSGMSSFFSLLSSPDQAETDFIHFIDSGRCVEEERAVLRIHIAQILKRWLMVNGNISLHASTIVRRRIGLLFLGRSGAGKSTVAELSKPPYRVLHDEKVFLTQRDGNYILSKIPNLDEIDESIEGNGIVLEQPDNRSDIYLAGIFELKQDTKDYLQPMSKLNTAQALMVSFLELPRILALSSHELQYALITLSKVARDVPAYELHFRKSPDFWKLIDAEFPG
jgi:hypothetical protein